MIVSLLQKGMRAQTSHPASGHRSFCVPFPLSKMPPMNDDRTAGLWLPQLNYQIKALGRGGWGSCGCVHFQPGRLVAARLGNLYESLWLNAVLRMLG